MLDLEVLICKLFSVDAGAACAVCVDEVATLAHEISNNTMEDCAFVPDWLVVWSDDMAYIYSAPGVVQGKAEASSRRATHLYSPVHNCLKFSAVLKNEHKSKQRKS